MAGRRTSAVPVTDHLPLQQINMSEWALFFLTASIDILCSTGVGVVPASGVQLIRFAVVFALYREWVLAIACSFFIPAMVPLTAICFVKRSWVAFRATALTAVERERARMAAASGPPRPAGVPQRQAGQGDRATQRGGDRLQPPGEMSGYDVSTASSEEVIELTSWKDSTSSSTEPSRTGPRLRRR